MSKTTYAVVFVCAVIILGTGVFMRSGTFPPEQIFCTAEAKMCPDGSYVGRTGPNCEFSACSGGGGETCSGGRCEGPQVLILRLNETGEASGISLRPLEIVEESRCPSDVQCIQAGTVRVRVELRSGLGTAVSIITLGEFATTEAQKITLTGVNPYPHTERPITPQDYQFTFKVEEI